jgi:hypothetical protein
VKQNQLREKGKELCLPLDADNGELEPLNNALVSFLASLILGRNGIPMFSIFCVLGIFEGDRREDRR